MYAGFNLVSFHPSPHKLYDREFSLIMTRPLITGWGVGYSEREAGRSACRRREVKGVHAGGEGSMELRACREGGHAWRVWHTVRV